MGAHHEVGGLKWAGRRRGLRTFLLMAVVVAVGLRCAPGTVSDRTFTTVIDSPIADESLSVSPGRPAARAVLTTLADTLPLADATQLSLALDARDVDVILGGLAPAPGARTLTIRFSLAPDDGSDPCAATDLSGEFTVTVDGTGAVVSVEPPALQFSGDALATIALGDVTLCTRIEAAFAADVALAQATVAVVVGGSSTNDNGGTSGNDNASNGNSNSSPSDNANDNGSGDDSSGDNANDNGSDDDNGNDNSDDDQGNDNGDDDSDNQNDNDDDSADNDNSSDDDSSGNDNGSDDGGNDNNDDSSSNDNSSDDDDGGSGNTNDNRDDDGDDDSNGGGDDD